MSEHEVSEWKVSKDLTYFSLETYNDYLGKDYELEVEKSPGGKGIYISCSGGWGEMAGIEVEPENMGALRDLIKVLQKHVEIMEGNNERSSF